MLNPLHVPAFSTRVRSWSLLASNLSCSPDGLTVGTAHSPHQLGAQQGHWDLSNVEMTWISGRPGATAADRALPVPYSMIHLVGDSTVENLCQLLGVPAQKIEDPLGAAAAGLAGAPPIELCGAGSRGRWHGVEVCCTAIKGEFPRGARMLRGVFEAAGSDRRRRTAVVFNEAGLWQVKHTPLELFNETFPTLLDATLGLPANVDIFWVSHPPLFQCYQCSRDVSPCLVHCDAKLRQICCERRFLTRATCCCCSTRVAMSAEHGGGAPDPVSVEGVRLA